MKVHTFSLVKHASLGCSFCPHHHLVGCGFLRRSDESQHLLSVYFVPGDNANTSPTFPHAVLMPCMGNMIVITDCSGGKRGKQSDGMRYPTQEYLVLELVFFAVDHDALLDVYKVSKDQRFCHLSSLWFITAPCHSERRNAAGLKDGHTKSRQNPPHTHSKIGGHNIRARHCYIPSRFHSVPVWASCGWL